MPTELIADEPRPAPPQPVWWRGLPRVVWAATAVWVSLLLVWSLVLPMFRSPDESQHVAAGVHLEHHRTWPGFRQLPPDAGVERAGFTFGVVVLSTDPHPVLGAADALDRGSRPSFSDLGAGNQMPQALTVGQHPPGYYALTGTASSVLPEGIPADLEVWMLRLLSIAMIAPLPIVLAGAVRRLGGPPAAVSTAAILTLCVPELAVISSSVNNDNLLNAAAAWVTLGVVLVLGGDLRRRTGVLIGVAVGVALLAKAFALVLLPVVVAAYLIGGRRRGRWQACLPGLAAFAGVSLLGGWWWIHNFFRYGQLQPSGHMAPRPAGRISVSDGLIDYLGQAVDRVPGRFWAVLGIKGGGEVAFPFWLTATLSVLLLGLLVAALLRRRIHAATRTDIVVLLTPFGLVAAILLVSTWNIYARTGYPAGLQGRYLFIGLTGVMVVLALLFSEWSGRQRDLMPIVTASGSLAITLFALIRVAQFHWGIDRSSLSGVPGAVLNWSPLPRWGTVGFGVLFMAATTWLVLALVLEWRAARPAPGECNPVAQN